MKRAQKKLVKNTRLAKLKREYNKWNSAFNLGSHTEALGMHKQAELLTHGTRAQQQRHQVYMSKLRAKIENADRRRILLKQEITRLTGGK